MRSHRWVASKCGRCAEQRDKGHTWAGCKCTTCGKTRDEFHAWKDCKCSVCKKARDEFHAWKGDIAWWKGNSRGELHSVGQKRPNAWGLFDILGNVAEWTFGPLPRCGAVRACGGSWDDDSQRQRAAVVFSRLWQVTTVGFRLARPVTTPAAGRPVPRVDSSGSAAPS